MKLFAGPLQIVGAFGEPETGSTVDRRQTIVGVSQKVHPIAIRNLGDLDRYLGRGWGRGRGLGRAVAGGLRALLLDARLELLAEIAVEEQGTGDVPLLLRPVLRAALELEASGLILVGTRAGGGADPDAADVAAARQVMSACRALDIRLHDHVILTGHEWRSFRSLGLM